MYLKWSEGRVSFFGKWSSAGQRRIERREARLRDVKRSRAAAGQGEHVNDGENHVLGDHEDADIKAADHKSSSGESSEGAEETAATGSGRGPRIDVGDLERVVSLRK